MDNDELSDPENISASFVRSFYDHFAKIKPEEEIKLQYDVFKRVCKVKRQKVLDKYYKSNFEVIE